MKTGKPAEVTNVVRSKKDDSELTTLARPKSRKIERDGSEVVVELGRKGSRHA